MKKLLLAAAFSAGLASVPALAHHAAVDIIDEEVYAMIDDLVTDTAHADLSFDDMGGDTTETTVSASTLRSLENLIDDGLLEYASMLDGDVTVDISFEDSGDVVLTITQRP